MMKRIIWMISSLNRRIMKLLFALALIAYIASVWGTYTNMRSIQEIGEMKIKQQIEDVVAPLKEKIRDLEQSFSQKYPPVKFLSEKDRKRILITGGAGFVGSHLTDKLMMDGHEVTVVDNFFTGRKRNVEHWIGHENFELINHDVVEPLYIEVDQIYHLASPASPPNYMYNPIKTLKTNTIGTLNMLGLAKRVGARLLLASTSEVYGDPEVHPQNEDYWGHVNPIGPRACYDEGKRVAETMCYAYMKQEGVEVRVARIFNTFGSRMHMNDGRVVSNFILQALQGEPLTVYGTGSQTRAFQYVSDLVNGLVLLMNSNISSPVNLGNPEEHTILEFARLIKSLVGVYTCREGLFKSVSWEVWQHLGYAIKAKLLFILIMINRETELQFQCTQGYKNCHQPNILRVCFFVFFKGIVWCVKMVFFLSFSYILDLCYTCLKFNDITALFMAQWSRYRYMPTHAHDKR
uniref:UDP-glucuronic acid decarboxylase 1 n=1 Tax=Oreochromis niloticus TaxID=8128 RepID=I3K9S3_ORENI